MFGLGWAEVELSPEKSITINTVVDMFSSIGVELSGLNPEQSSHH